MMTPKELQEQGFTRSRKGYDMTEVDDFMDKVTEDYTTLYNNYKKLSTAYSSLRKKAQQLAAALEQNQSKTTAVVANAQTAQAAQAASQDAVNELLNTARKDAQAIRAGAEAERQEIINNATNYAAQNAERLKKEVAEQEARLAALKKETDAYITNVRALTARISAQVDSSPVAEPAAQVSAAADAEAVVTDEPTIRMDSSEADVAEEISRNMELNVSDLNDAAAEAAPAVDALEVDSVSDMFEGLDDEFDEE